MPFKSRAQQQACFASGGFGGKVDCDEWQSKTKGKLPLHVKPKKRQVYSLTHAQAKKMTKRLAPNAKLVLVDSMHDSMYIPGTHTIRARPEKGDIAHEAVHARQHDKLGNLMAVPVLLPWAGLAASIGLQTLRNHPRLRNMPKYLPTIINGASFIPQLAMEAHANLAALKDGETKSQALQSMGSYLTQAGLSTAVTGIFDKMHHPHYSIGRKMKRLKYAGEGLGVVRINPEGLNLASGPTHTMGRFVPTVAEHSHSLIPGALRQLERIEGPPLNIAKSIYPKIPLSVGRRILNLAEAGGRKAGRVGVSLGGGALGGLKIYTTYVILKGILDSLSGTRLGRHLPDIKTDVEMIPTYSKTAKALAYALHYESPSHVHIADKINLEMANLKTVSNEGLHHLNKKLQLAAITAHSPMLRRISAFWNGLVTAELLGRSVGSASALTSQQYAIYGDNDNPEKYWVEQIPKIAGTVFKGVKKVMGLGNAAKSVGEAATAVKPTAWQKVKGAAGAALTAGFLADTTMGLRNKHHAQAQMNQWDQDNSLQPPTQAWQSSTGYALMSREDPATTHRMFIHHLDKEAGISRDQAQAAAESHAVFKEMQRLKHRRLIKGGLIGAGGALGAGITARLLRNYSLRDVPFQVVKWLPDFRAAGRLQTRNLISVIKHQRRNGLLPKGGYGKGMQSIRAVLANEAENIRKSVHVKNDADKFMVKHIRRLTDANQELRDRLENIGIAQLLPAPPVVERVIEKTKIRKPLSNLMKAGIGSVAVGSGFGALEAGRRLGKQEERTRLRRLADMDEE